MSDQQYYQIYELARWGVVLLCLIFLALIRLLWDRT